MADRFLFKLVSWGYANIQEYFQEYFISFLAFIYALIFEQIPEEIIIELGITEANSMKSQYKAVIALPSDPDVTLVKTIVEKMSLNPAARHLNWKVVVVKSPVVNLCALPDGHIFVFEGFLDLINRNEHALAYVIGHEMAHVICNHSREYISENAAIPLLTTFLFSLTAFCMGDTGFLVPMAVFELLKGYVFDSLLLLMYSREHEMEADEIGLYMCAEGIYIYIYMCVCVCVCVVC